MEIILNKGGQKLCYAGYIYTKSTKKNSIQWERTQTKGLNCGGAVCTDTAVQTVHVYTAMNPVTAQYNSRPTKSPQKACY